MRVPAAGPAAGMGCPARHPRGPGACMAGPRGNKKGCTLLLLPIEQDHAGSCRTQNEALLTLGLVRTREMRGSIYASSPEARSPNPSRPPAQSCSRPARPAARLSKENTRNSDICDMYSSSGVSNIIAWLPGLWQGAMDSGIHMPQSKTARAYCCISKR